MWGGMLDSHIVLGFWGFLTCTSSMIFLCSLEALLHVCLLSKIYKASKESDVSIYSGEEGLQGGN